MENDPKTTPPTATTADSTEIDPLRRKTPFLDPNLENQDKDLDDEGLETDPETEEIPEKLPTQAERIFAKFGNATRLHQYLVAIGRPYNKASIYKWSYPRSKGGTNGWIPTRAWPDILAVARYEGVFISSEEMDPRTYEKQRRFK